jgi:hypothetical protein
MFSYTIEESAMNPSKPFSERSCVLYDPATGRIAYGHREITVGDRRVTSEEEFEARTRRLASARGRRGTADLKSLHLSAVKLKSHKRYKVDLSSNALIEVDAL